MVTWCGTTAIIATVRATGSLSTTHGGRTTTSTGVTRASPRPSHIIVSVVKGPGDSSATAPPGTAFAVTMPHSSMGMAMLRATISVAARGRATDNSSTANNACDVDNDCCDGKNMSAA